MRVKGMILLLTAALAAVLLTVTLTSISAPLGLSGSWVGIL